MKDYRLSEIKEICEKMQEEYGSNACDMCENTFYEVEQFCIHKIGDDCPCEWDIDPRDMIELPCKEHFTYTHDNGHITENWRVYYRSEFDLIETAIFQTETEADEFMAVLKGGKQ